jgi:hypothetical protein
LTGHGAAAGRSGHALSFVRAGFAFPTTVPRQASVRRSSGRSTSLPQPRGHASRLRHAPVDERCRASAREAEREMSCGHRAWWGFLPSPRRGPASCAVAAGALHGAALALVEGADATVSSAFRPGGGRARARRPSKAEGGGLFKDIEMNRQTQIEPADLVVPFRG